MQSMRLWGVQVVLLEDDEFLIRVAHPDPAFESGVRKGFDDVALGSGCVGALVGVEGEAEGALVVEGPELGGGCADGGVEVVVEF